MKTIFNFLILVFVSLATIAQDDLFFSIEQNTISDWNYVSDRVMGGVSTGGASLEKDGDVTLQGLPVTLVQEIMAVLYSCAQRSRYLTNHRCFSRFIMLVKMEKA